MKSKERINPDFPNLFPGKSPASPQQGVYQTQTGPLQGQGSHAHQLTGKAQRVLVVPSSASAAVSTATPFSPMEQMEELNVAQSSYCFATEQQLQVSTSAVAEPVRAQVNLCAQ